VWGRKPTSSQNCKNERALPNEDGPVTRKGGQLGEEERGRSESEEEIAEGGGRCFSKREGVEYQEK